LTKIHATLGLAQLEQIETFIAKRRQVFQWYAQYLSDLPGILLNTERPGTKNVYWMTSFVLPPDSPLKRDEFMVALRNRGIDSRPFFVPMHQLPHLARYRAVGRDGEGCPQASWLGAKGLNLPSGPHLDESTVRRISDVIKDLLQCVS